MTKKRKHSNRYHLKVHPKNRFARMLLYGAIGLGMGYLFAGGDSIGTIGWGIFCATVLVGLMELYAATHACILDQDGLTVVGPVTVRGPKTDVEIPYGALVTVEERGSKLRLGYQVDPLLTGEPPTHHLQVEPEDTAALLRALTNRMQRAHRRHHDERARNRYRVALTFLGAMALAAGGGALGA